MYIYAWSRLWSWDILFSPAIMDWWIDATGAWYRPISLADLIVVTFILQSQKMPMSFSLTQMLLISAAYWPHCLAWPGSVSVE